MKRQMVVFGLALAIVATLSWLAGCRRSALPIPAGEEVMELHAYTVPDGYENEVRRMLRNALGTDDSRIGRVDVGPGGKLVVVAPVRIHGGIAEFIEELSGLETPLTTPKAVSITYWLLVGRPKGGSPGDYSVSRGGKLEELAPALLEIATSQGATEFGLLERSRLSSTDANERANAQGSHASINQRATSLDGKVVAEIQVMIRGSNSIMTEVILEPGQFLVLGQTGYSGKVGDVFDAGDGPLTLYYVVVAHVES